MLLVVKSTLTVPYLKLTDGYSEWTKYIEYTYQSAWWYMNQLIEYSFDNFSYTPDHHDLKLLDCQEWDFRLVNKCTIERKWTFTVYIPGVTWILKNIIGRNEK
jgi:hypothetical protein